MCDGYWMKYNVLLYSSVVKGIIPWRCNAGGGGGAQLIDYAASP